MHKRVCSPSAYRAKSKFNLPKWCIKGFKREYPDTVPTSSAQHTKGGIINHRPSAIPAITRQCGDVDERHVPVPIVGHSERTVEFAMPSGVKLGPKCEERSRYRTLTSDALISHLQTRMTKEARALADTVEPLAEPIVPYVSYGKVETVN